MFKTIGKDEPLTIYRDGIEVAQVVGEPELLRWFHQKHSYSLHHATTWEGYSVRDSANRLVEC